MRIYKTLNLDCVFHLLSTLCKYLEYKNSVKSTFSLLLLHKLKLISRNIFHMVVFFKFSCESEYEDIWLIWHVISCLSANLFPWNIWVLWKLLLRYHNLTNFAGKWLFLPFLLKEILEVFSKKIFFMEQLLVYISPKIKLFLKDLEGFTFWALGQGSPPRKIGVWNWDSELKEFSQSIR